jgi:catechol 2,3-dioxygenase-like lactoylglutathione lyase family enzyme
MPHHLRIARPVRDLARATDMYRRGLGLQVLGGFENHEGFDGVMLGTPGADHHFEFTRCRTHVVAPTPTVEDLLVFHVPAADEWEAACERMLGAGFRRVAAFNPYWDVRGLTFADDDGYRVVLERAEWPEVER